MNEVTKMQFRACHQILVRRVQTLCCGKNRKGTVSTVPQNTGQKPPTTLPKAGVKAQPQRLNCLPSRGPGSAGITGDKLVDVAIRFAATKESNSVVAATPSLQPSAERYGLFNAAFAAWLKPCPSGSAPQQTPCTVQLHSKKNLMTRPKNSAGKLHLSHIHFGGAKTERARFQPCPSDSCHTSTFKMRFA